MKGCPMQKIRQDRMIGQNLRFLRLERGFTQEQTAAQLQLAGVDIDRAAYSRYETGELNIPVSVLAALHNIYGCSYDAFFKGV